MVLVKIKFPVSLFAIIDERWRLILELKLESGSQLANFIFLSWQGWILVAYLQIYNSCLGQELVSLYVVLYCKSF